MHALYKFKPFIFGKEVTVETDKMSLFPFFRQNIDKMPMRVQKWMRALQPFDFDLRHISGKSNVIADSLLRVPDIQQPFEVENTNEMVCLVMQDYPVTEDEIGAAGDADDEI